MDGGVLIVHQFNEGKHRYEVESVYKPNKKHFLRRGDTLTLVNETELQDVPPEKLSQILSEGSPKLTVHKSVKKKPVEVDPADEDVMVPFSKKEMFLRFSRMMIPEEQLDQDQDLDVPTGGEEGDICTEEGGPQEEEEGDEAQSHFLIVSMKKTSILVVAGRSCDPTLPCVECNGQCHFTDVVMVNESTSVTLVSRGPRVFSREKCNEAELEHIHSHLFMRSLCSQNSVYMSQSPERITIYYYKFKPVSKGLPVVLNFTGSECFLKCSRNEVDRVMLTVEVCDKQKLKKISHSDHAALSFMFYMKSDPGRNTTFESALHQGWFIRVSDGQVEMDCPGPTPDISLEAHMSMSFNIIIRKKACCS